MNARVPQDVDLEDQLIYGLSPLRFAYIVVAALVALATWRGLPAPAALRALPAVLLLTAAAVLAWGRWRGRHLDRWLLDLAVFVRRNYRLGIGRRPRSAGAATRFLRAVAAVAAGARRRPGRPRDGEQAVIVRLSAINALPGPGVRPDPDPDASDLPPAA
jgi:PrgI family protein